MIAYRIFSPVIHFAESLAGVLQPTPVYGEAGVTQDRPGGFLPGQKRTVLYMWVIFMSTVFVASWIEMKLSVNTELIFD
jgi:hypothetical protein